MNFYEKIAAFIQENNLVQTGDRILLSLSAGKDSMALLDVMEFLSKEMRFSIGIFHLNHLSRGKESDEDEFFLADLIGSKDLPLFVERFDCTAKPGGVSFEDFARTKRYEYLSEIAKKEKYTGIATGHTRNDNIETLVMRIFSGTGLMGLGGIEVRRDNIIRPLIDISTREVLDHLHRKKIKWNEDSSNKDEYYLRNYVRHSLLPEILERFPKAFESLENLSNLSKEYIDLLNELLVNRYGMLYSVQKTGRVNIDYEFFNGDFRIFRHVLLTAIRKEFGITIDRQILNEIIKVLESDSSHLILYKNKKLTIKKTLEDGKGRVIIIDKNNGMDNDETDETEWYYSLCLDNLPMQIDPVQLPFGFEIRLCSYNEFLNSKDRYDMFFIALQDDIEYIVIRNKRPGDRIKFDFGTKKIKEIMIENKLDSSVKQSIPLLLVGEDVIGVLLGFFGIGQNKISSEYRVWPGSQKILVISKK